MCQEIGNPRTCGSGVSWIQARSRLFPPGHRIVHGGSIDLPVVIDEAVIDVLSGAGALAPVHQQRALAGLSAARAALPAVPHVACFDTTFHRTLPDSATTYALPASWRRWPLQRRGFHGLSHSYVARTAPSVLAGRPGPRPRRIASCHLGSGGSVCAILGGSGDMRDILSRRAGGDQAATLAFDVYIHRLRAAIGAMAASLGGIDLLAFTGGIGEHLPEVRRAATAGLGFLGIDIMETDLDTSRPEPVSTSGDRDITAPDAAAGCVVVATGEDHAIATTTRTVLAGTDVVASEPGTA